MRVHVASAVAGATLLCALPALANGRFPGGNEILFSPVNANAIWVRATYGLLPSADNGASWAYVCEDVFGLVSQGGNGYEDPAIGLMANGNIVATDSHGVSVSTDNGCTWSCQSGMLAAQSVVDLDVFPSDASTAVALVSSPVLLDSSNNNFFTQVFETTDDGVTWAPVGVPLDPTVIVTTIDVPKSDPTRIYVSGTRGFGGGITASLFVYTTASGVWVEQPIPGFDPSVEDSVYIGAVDPNDADVVYLRSRGLAGGGQSRLFVTRNASASPADGGATFTEPAGASFDVPDVTGTEIVGQLEGFALSPDGSKVYVGTEESGVWMAPATTLAFTQMNAKPVTQGLATRLTPQGTTELWACSKASGGFVVGVSTDDGATFEAKLCSITGLTGVASCPAVSNPTLGCAAPGDTRAVCPMVLSDFCAVYTGGACEPCGGDEGGAGSDAAPPDAGTAAAAKKPSSCGCSAVGSSGDADGALAGLFVAAMAFARRRRHESRLD